MGAYKMSIAFTLTIYYPNDILRPLVSTVYLAHLNFMFLWIRQKIIIIIIILLFVHIANRVLTPIHCVSLNVSVFKFLAINSNNQLEIVFG